MIRWLRTALDLIGDRHAPGMSYDPLRAAAVVRVIEKLVARPVGTKITAGGLISSDQEETATKKELHEERHCHPFAR